MHRLTKPSAQTPRGMRAMRTQQSLRRVTAMLGARGAAELRCRSRDPPQGAKSNAAVRSPAFARTPGSGSSPKRRVMNLMIDVVS